jgi:hypothetical protein
MYKFLFKLLTDPLGLPVSLLWEYIILLIINEIAYKIAWKASPGGRFGSEIHWAVRIPSFIIIWTITYCLICLVKWICSNWIFVLCILGAILIIGLLVTIIVSLKNRRRDTV